jgi:hypothetical protein
MTSGDDEVQVLVEELSAQLGRSVLVDDASLRLVAYSPTYGTEDEVRRTAILTRETPRVIRDIHFSQGIATASRPVRTAAKPELGLQSRVCAPIRCVWHRPSTGSGVRPSSTSGRLASGQESSRSSMTPRPA